MPFHALHQNMPSEKQGQTAGSETGFTITEVIIAAMIFALAAAGIIATVTALKQPATDTGREVTAAMLGRQVLEQLRSQVTPATWNTTGNLSVGSHQWPVSPTIDGTTYTISYSVASGTTDARQVIMNVAW